MDSWVCMASIVLVANNGIGGGKAPCICTVDNDVRIAKIFDSL